MSENQPSRRTFSLPTGGTAVTTLLRLVVASLVVGALLALLGINPIELWKSILHGIERGVDQFFDFGVEGISLVITLIATGAVIVVPIWLLRMILSSRR